MIPDQSGRPREVALGGRRIRVDDDKPTFWDRVEAGRWEPGTLAVLDRHLGPGTTFVDLGAWVGALSLYAAIRGAHVIAVEADPAALDQLRRNVAANPDLAVRIAIVPRAISADAAPVRLAARRKPGDSMSSVLLAGPGRAGWEAEAVTPTELAALAGDGPVFVKLDIEGGEYRLMPALRPLLAGFGAALLVSFHPAILRESGEGDPVGATERALAIVAGWRSYAIEDGGPVPRPADAHNLARADLDGSADTWLFLAGPDLGCARPNP